MPDDSIFYKIKQGDEQALKAFTKDNYLTFCAVADRFVENIQEAEDIVQDVLIKLWEDKEKYGEISCLKSFVYTMIRNRALNNIRKRKRAYERLKSKPKEENYNFLNLLIEEECSRLLLEAIETLPEQSARIIKLSLQGLKNNEIAQKLSISENTVKVLKYRSLKRLRLILQDHLFAILLLFI